MITGLLLGLGMLACGLVGYFLLHGRARDKNAHSARCPHCGQKFRYSASRAGCLELCPRCKHEWMLPAAPATAKALREKERYRVKRI